MTLIARRMMLVIANRNVAEAQCRAIASKVLHAPDEVEGHMPPAAPLRDEV